MNINMKYYIVTIGSIFLALGIGIIVGFNLNYDQELSKQQSEVLSQFEEKFDSLNEEKSDLNKQIDSLNEKYDKLYEKLLVETDQDKIKELVQEMQQILVDDGAALIHGYYKGNICSTKAVEGANVYTADYYWISTAIKPAE